MPREDEDDCVFHIKVDPSSLAELKRLLDVDHLSRAGCRVKKHPDCCVLCAMNNDCTRLPLHFECFPAETLVSACHLKRAYRRWYQGELVEIVTACGSELRGTPNHPVLTSSGWVALGALSVGDYVIRSAFDEGVGILDPDVHHVPAEIGQVFDSLADSGQRVRAVGSDMQFHGDGSDGYVDVVTQHGELGSRGHVALAEPLNTLPLAATDLAGHSLASEGSSMANLSAVGLTATRSLSGGTPGCALLDSSGRHHQAVGVPNPPVVGESVKELGECRAASAAALGKSVGGLAGAVAPDQVVGVRRLPFNGHVYNLETQAGWYLANNTLAKNCRCKPEGYLEITNFYGHGGEI